MKRVMFTLVIGLVFGASAYASAPMPYAAQYEVQRDGSDYGEAQRSLQQTADGRFELYTETEISWMFLSDRRRYWSTFVWQDDRVVTLKFGFKRSGTGKNRQFDASYPEQPPVLDEAALLEQLRVDLADPNRNEFRYTLVDEKGATDHHVYQRGATETLQLPYGQVVATKVARIREHSDRETYYWFAPEFTHVLVKMQQIEAGDEVATLVLRKLTLAE